MAQPSPYAAPEPSPHKVADAEFEKIKQKVADGVFILECDNTGRDPLTCVLCVQHETTGEVLRLVGKRTLVLHRDAWLETWLATFLAVPRNDAK